MDERLKLLIEYVREGWITEGPWRIPGQRERDHSVPSLVVGLARFQSYRARTEAALVQELTDYIEEAGLSQLNFEVHDDAGVVQLW